MSRFEFDLQYSNKGIIEDSFIEVYEKMWPKADYMKVEDIGLQRRGIDRIISYPGFGDKQIFVDEKIRRVDYGDIAIEEYSDFGRRKPGWIQPSKHTDYIAYGIEPARKVYLLPFETLRRAFINNYSTWKHRRRFTKAELNNGYRTSFITVSPSELFEALTEAMKFQSINSTH